jgi:hypothetical protein
MILEERSKQRVAVARAQRRDTAIHGHAIAQVMRQDGLSRLLRVLG